MSDTDTSTTSEPTSEPSANAGPNCAVPTGSTVFPTERKVLIALGVLCIFTIAGSVVAVGFYAHPVAGLFSLAAVACWIGAAIAETLKKTKNDNSSNTTLSHDRRREAP